MANGPFLTCFWLILICVVQTYSYKFVNRNACQYTPTKVSGTHAPTGRICKGQLLLDEQFDNFDKSLWQHELTLGGGGVSFHTKIISMVEPNHLLANFFSPSYVCVCVCSRIGNSNGTPMIRITPT